MTDMTMTDMTITAIRTAMLRVPWPADALAQGPRVRRRPQHSGARRRDPRRHRRHGLSAAVPAGMRTHRGLSRGSHDPARDRQGRQRRRGDLAGPVALERHLWPRRHRHHGDVGCSTSRCGTRSASAPTCRCTGCGDIIARQLPAYGSGCFRGSGGDGMIAKALHYKERGYKAIKMQVAHTADLATDLDNVRRMREALGPGHRHHDRRQYGLDRRRRHSDGPKIPGLRRLLARGAGGAGRFCRLSAHRRGARSAHRRRRDPFHPFRPQAVLRKSAVADPAARSDARRARPNCARSRPSPTPGA